MRSGWFCGSFLSILLGDNKGPHYQGGACFLLWTRDVQAYNAYEFGVLPKKETVKSFADLRPISLSSFMNKIISRMVHERMILVLPNIISQTQSGFVKGRSITENILLAQEIIRDINRRNKNINVVVKLDMAKAYDRVSWIFLTKVLRKFGFAEASNKLEQVLKVIPAIIMWELWKRRNSFKHGMETSYNRMYYQCQLTIHQFIRGFEVDSSLPGCCTHVKELMEDGRESVKFHHIGKGIWIGVVDLGRDELDLVCIFGQS
ncbi:hypothetical protein MTR67_019035 [Solanum verrucosum]|uniref:Reverse transcriptase domain-containing protein n=1 Tax=Solanum verrucosum TaxID=315347 RepID=A0AAF0QR10_SOLVR|nr:hypothetical protein MTR67_019035 [Solanum verrucosum]